MTNEEFDQMFDVLAAARFGHQYYASFEETTYGFRWRIDAPEEEPGRRKRKKKEQTTESAAGRLSRSHPGNHYRRHRGLPLPGSAPASENGISPLIRSVITIIRRGRATAGIRRALALVFCNVCSQHGSRAHRRRRLQGNQPPLLVEPPSTVRGSTATGPYG
ncbi:hypothetical protein ILUMI_15744 [Ignelater luminosus]|uniref:Uncharacterized protein n=1 Tax=Ignelater luminosus TaxID=2038154 RepID=A0A8K0G8U2_IGNLU|nr:hypothetical protein ILUMI_15744 [Ignelater luminosus]